MIREKKAEGFENEQFFVVSNLFLTDYLKNPYPHSLLITLMGYFPRALNHYMKRPEGCGTALLIYCGAGSGFYSINGSPAKTLSAGQLVILPPHTPHEYGASEDKPWSIYWVHFKGPFYPPFYKAVSPYFPVSTGDIMGDRIKGIFNRCFCLLQLPYQKEEYFYLCQMVSVMLSIIPCTVKQSTIGLTLDGSEGIERAIGFMRSHLHKRITGAELAEYTHFSSNLPVRDIALTYGIEDPYYFLVRE
ncbi:MAG: AraC family ligand binding domain-containing protein [Treponema sp.]|jgi:hypothetical protein|nr:AraC family ligand binding domain-containing protein [Treponema sp.]